MTNHRSKFDESKPITIATDQSQIICTCFKCLQQKWKTVENASYFVNIVLTDEWQINNVQHQQPCDTHADETRNKSLNKCKQWINFLIKNVFFLNNFMYRVSQKGCTCRIFVFKHLPSKYQLPAKHHALCTVGVFVLFSFSN